MQNKLQAVRTKAQNVRRKGALKWRRARRHVLLLPVMSALALIVVVLGIFLTFRITGTSSLLRPTDTTTVEISYDKQRRTVPTTARTVGELLKKMAISLKAGDTVEPTVNTEIFGDNFRVNVYRAMPVVVIDGEQKTYAVSAATTPRSIARQVGLTVYPEDKLVVDDPGNFVQNYALGKQITIQRSVPVNVNVYGRFTAMRTLGATVGDMLKEKHIDLPDGNSVFPAASTPITPNMQVFVSAKGVKIEVVEEAIAMPIETVQDKSLSFGVTVVRQQGSAGKRLITYQTNEKTGERIKIQEFIAQEPVTQVVAKGAYSNIPSDKQAVMAAAGISASDYMYVDYIVGRESHWNAGAANASSGAYGLCQALPGSKMASAGSDWQTNPVTQLRWCSGYAAGKGGWAASYNLWVSQGWW